MNKLLLFLIVGLMCSNAGAQNLFITKDAKINFNSSTPVEDIIDAHNAAATLNKAIEAKK